MSASTAVATSPLKLVREFFGMKLADMKSEYQPLPQADKTDLVSALTPDPETGVPSYTY